MRQLADKVVMITGSGRGIGAAMVQAFEKAGAKVIGVTRSAGIDVSREEDVVRAFGGIQRLDVLINNAGVLTPRKRLQEVTAREWDETMAVNLRGVFLCTRAALPIMVARKSGLIINFSSGVGHRAAPTWGPYAVSKWGVEGLTKSVAEEVKADGVKLITVNPGGTRTEMRAMAYPAEKPETLKTAEAVAEWVVGLAAGEMAFQTGDSLNYPEVKR